VCPRYLFPVLGFIALVYVLITDQPVLLYKLLQSHLDEWKRPSLQNIDTNTEPIIFQQLDVDHYIDDCQVDGMPTIRGGTAPVLRMFGLTMEGHSVVCHVHGFLPYFYVKAMTGFQVLT